VGALVTVFCTCAGIHGTCCLMGKAVAKSAKRAWRKLDVSATEVRRATPFARARARARVCDLDLPLPFSDATARCS